MPIESHANECRHRPDTIRSYTVDTAASRNCHVGDRISSPEGPRPDTTGLGRLYTRIRRGLFLRESLGTLGAGCVSPGVGSVQSVRPTCPAPPYNRSNGPSR